MQNINKLKLKGCSHKHNWFLRTIQNNCQFIQIIYSYADMETKATKRNMIIHGNDFWNK